MVSPAVLFSKKGGRRALIGLIAGGIFGMCSKVASAEKKPPQTNGLLGKQIFLEALIVFFFVLILAELAARIRAAGRGKVWPHLYSQCCLGIGGAFGDFQKYAPLAGLSGGHICTLLFFYRDWNKRNTCWNNSAMA